MALESFVLYKNWLTSLEGLPVDQQDKIISEVVRYGVGMDLQHEDDAVIQAFVNMLKFQIDYKKQEYEDKVAQGKKGGRKKLYDNKTIYNMAQEGKTAIQIANELGCSRSTIDKSEGWKRREETGFEF